MLIAFKRYSLTPARVSLKAECKTFSRITQLFGRKKKRLIPEMTRGEALACKPVKNLDIEETRTDHNKVILAYPLRLKPIFSGIAKKYGLWKEGRPPMKRLELDDMGTMVWDMIDGKNSVKKISAAFAEKYTVLPREAEVATASFLKDLGKRGLIAFDIK